VFTRPIAIVTIAWLAAFFGGAQPVSAASGLAASWLVTYYLDPTGSMGSVQCVNFGKTGETDGVARGLWHALTLSGWKGEWVTKGEHFAWHGAYTANGETTVTYATGDFINRDQAAVTSAASLKLTSSGVVTRTTGTATMVQVARCSGAPLHRGTDPMSEF